MQFPVPQFTEVEDKIIGPLTLKQFGIVFGAGILVFLVYTVSGKNLIAGIVALLFFGLPGLGVAFAKINGRPLYNSLSYMLEFIFSQKVLIFHKEINSHSSSSKVKNAEVKSATQVAASASPQTVETTESRIKKVHELLHKKAEEEADLAKKIE